MGRSDASPRPGHSAASRSFGACVLRQTGTGGQAHRGPAGVPARGTKLRKEARAFPRASPPVPRPRGAGWKAGTRRRWGTVGHQDAGAWGSGVSAWARWGRPEVARPSEARAPSDRKSVV